ncbi:hypothetical protein B1812_01840 [Methylocystis bryophila]|uniref:N-acetyltransferase domain-containing protein n=1 Tax=Methylocystis bryophila TaxID=655015 RepID=A0A1W6MR28_9HYPH|nr:hypothetical protein B1812_01840 [Methylocystis bryophila]
MGGEETLTIKLSTTAATATYRSASCEDAAAISELYQEAYRPVSGGDASDFYPYPQLLTPGEVKGMIQGGGVLWLVAELDGAIIGACGAVLNVGAPEDKIAEVFGLVIKERFRYRGYGAQLFAQLDGCLAREGSLFILAETRTAHSGGWKVARRCGFIALGFEPAAHLTPAGYESMLLTGKLSSRALELWAPPTASSVAVQRLSAVVLEQIQGARPLVQNKETPALEAGFCDESHAVHVAEATYDESKIVDVLQRLGLQRTGFIVLNRMRGILARSCRFERKFLVASRGEQAVGYAILDQDARDRRVKIADLRGCDGQVLETLLRHVIEIAKAGIGAVFSLVVDVRSGEADLHRLLEEIGFFPTAYYPALILEGGNRIDSVQFTYLEKVDLTEACRGAAVAEWPSAFGVKGEICDARL